jgi:hypothetical protein
LVVQIIGDGIVFLLSDTLLGQNEQALFSRAVDDRLLAEFVLEEAEAGGDFVVKVRVVGYGFGDSTLEGGVVCPSIGRRRLPVWSEAVGELSGCGYRVAVGRVAFVERPLHRR